MSIMNRRNAMLGWATWTAAKQIAARKARAATHADERKSRRLLIILPLLAAAGAVIFFWRHTSDDGVPPAGE